MDATCRCGSKRLEVAQIEGAALRPERSSTLKKVFNVGGLMRCHVCLDCGAIFNLRADPQKLTEMLS